MLQITIQANEIYLEATNEFITVDKPVVLNLEHSLLSISKWEQKWHKPFLGDGKKTNDEMLDYIRCMTTNTKVDPAVYSLLTGKQVEEIAKYINDQATATTISKSPEGSKPARKEIITAEVIYYWMIEIGIPIEFEKRHLNHLLMLIQVCNIKRAPSKKMSKADAMKQNGSLNAARRRAHHSRG